MHSKISIGIFLIFFSLNISSIAQTGQLNLLEGIGNSEVNSIASDSQNNTIAVGFFDGTIDLDPSALVSSFSSTGLNDGFLIKTDPLGNYLWGKHFSGPAQIYSNSVSIDQNDNIYVTGIFEANLSYSNNSSTNTLNSLGDFDIFIFKYDPNGNLIWTRQVGDTLKELSPAIHAGKDNSVYLTASFEGSVDFDWGASTAIKSSTGQQDIFISKFDTAGNFTWVKQIEGNDYKYSGGIQADIQGNVYTTGSFASSVNFDEGNTAVVKTSNGGTDIFIAKYNNQGDLSWVNQIGSFGFDIGTSLVIDNFSNVYACGSFSASADFDSNNGVLNLNSNGSRDIYLTKLDSNGALSWANSIGGTALDIVAGIHYGSNDEVLITGRFSNSIDLDPSNGTSSFSSYGFSDAFFSRYSTSGINLGNIHIGGLANDFGNAISMNNAGNILVGGSITDSAYFMNYLTNSMIPTNNAKDAFIFSLPINLVGIDQFSEQNNQLIKSLNNISSHDFYIELNNREETIASIFNMQGQFIQEFSISQDKYFGSELSNGVYILQLRRKNSIQTTRLFKQ